MIDHEAARRTVEKAKQAGKIIAAGPLPLVEAKPRKKSHRGVHMKTRRP